MKIYTVINEHDPNDTFEVEAHDYEHALYAALSELGWFITEQKEDDEEE